MSLKSEPGSKKQKKTYAVSTRIANSLKRLSRQLLSHQRRLSDSDAQTLPVVVVAFSGGLDSVVLLHAATRLIGKDFAKVVAVHVHHGISGNADEWAQFCEAAAQKAGAEFILKKVSVEASGEGLEACARRLRYEALEAAALESAASAVLTAHHSDDQIETFLIQWMRGAGVEGLSAMPAFKEAGKTFLARPLLEFERCELESYARLKHLNWVEDESNEDTVYLRNAIRHNVIPKLLEARPGFKSAAQRSIELVAESSRILREVAQEDLDRVSEKETGFILLDAFFRLSLERQSRLLRLWLRKNGLKPLPRARLLEVIRQIKETEKQSVLLFTSNDIEVRRYGARLVAVPKERVEAVPDREIQWNGEGCIELPEFGGKLYFKPNPKGFNETYLKAMPLVVKRRIGRAKIKTHPFRPSKELKVLYQEAKIPDFERGKLPLVWRGKTLIYAAYLGEEVREKLDDDGSEKFSMEFVKDELLI